MSCVSSGDLSTIGERKYPCCTPETKTESSAILNQDFEHSIGFIYTCVMHVLVELPPCPSFRFEEVGDVFSQ